jgi:Na+-translocating ferredoxin:NAD+ oxidoreductase subunit A
LLRGRPGSARNAIGTLCDSRSLNPQGKAMSSYLFLLITTALVNNVVLVRFLGLCPFLGVSNRIDSALGMGMATTFVIVLTGAVCWTIDHWLLVPLDLGFLRILTFILVIAAVVQFTEMVIHKSAPSLYQTLGIYLPLIATNCAVLGLVLINTQEKHDFVTALIYDFGSACGFTIALVMFAGMRERLALAKLSPLFAGAPIALVLAGLMSLAFMGFSGLNLK